MPDPTGIYHKSGGLLRPLATVPGPRGQEGVGIGDHEAALDPHAQYLREEQLPVLATNLIANPSAENSLAYWGVYAGPGNPAISISRMTTTGAHSGGSYHRTTWAASATGAGGGSNVSTPIGAVAPGDRVSASRWVRTNVVKRIRLVLEWKNDASAQIGFTLGPVVSLQANVWTELKLEDVGPAPSGSSRVTIPVTSVDAWNAGDVLDADSAIVVKLPRVPAYFDGDSVGARWTGVPHDSTSELILQRKDETPALQAVETNLVLNPSARLSALNWTYYAGGGGTAAMSWNPLGGVDGGPFVRLTWSVGATSPAGLSALSARNVYPGDEVSGSIWVRCNQARSIRAGINHMGDNPTYIGTTWDPVHVTLVPNVWTKLTVKRSTVMAGANHVQVIAYMTGAQPGDVLDVDHPLIVRGAHLTDYFDGDSSEARWSGVPYNSPSELLVRRKPDITAIVKEHELQYRLRGRGSPQGVHAAPVGTIYIDEDVTAGALEWTKWSGTGTTGWVVTKGDTGWRTVEPMSPWALHGGFPASSTIRRVGDKVMYRGRLMPSLSLIGQNRVGLTHTLDLTAAWALGFRVWTGTSAFLNYGSASRGTNRPLGAFSMLGQTNRMDVDIIADSGTWVDTDRCYVWGEWPTGDGWPASLPGVNVS